MYFETMPNEHFYFKLLFLLFSLADLVAVSPAISPSSTSKSKTATESQFSESPKWWTDAENVAETTIASIAKMSSMEVSNPDFLSVLWLIYLASD